MLFQKTVQNHAVRLDRPQYLADGISIFLYASWLKIDGPEATGGFYHECI